MVVEKGFFPHKIYMFKHVQPKPEYARLYSTSPKLCFALQVRGYAYSGGGHAIIRVDVSADEGKTWTTAQLEPVYDRRYRYDMVYSSNSTTACAAS